MPGRATGRLSGQEGDKEVLVVLLKTAEEFGWEKLKESLM